MSGDNRINYEIITSKCITDGAEGATVYGFRLASSEGVSYPDISPSRAIVEHLVSILNSEQIKLSQLHYIVEDYICW